MLREQLAAFSGGKINFSWTQGAPRTENKIKVTYVENKEKMREMEEKIENDKKDIKKRFEH